MQRVHQTYNKKGEKCGAFDVATARIIDRHGPIYKVNDLRLQAAYIAFSDERSPISVYVLVNQLVDRAKKR